MKDSDSEGSEDATGDHVTESTVGRQLFDGPDEMEYVLPVVQTDVLPTNSAGSKPLIAPTVSPQKTRILDKRVFGDAVGWDKGSRLTLEGIKQAYCGLYDTLFNTGNYKSIFMQEFVVRPDTQLVMLMNAIAIAAKSIQLVFSRKQRSQGIISHPPRGVGASPSKSAINRSRGRWTAEDDEDDEDENEENVWDAVDIQVCVSRELRHRVILCQFLQKARSNGVAHNPERNEANSRIERVNKAIQVSN